jgi:hypothetical protein
MYRALKPIYVPIGDWFAVKWQVIGLAADMAEAKKLYGGSPVLEEVKP